MATKLDIPSILTKIVDVKRREVERLKVEMPLANLIKRIDAQTPPLSATEALRGENVGIVAEIKKASPAKGLLMPNFDAGALAETYVENGASAISVLTNVDHFQGSLEYLEVARRVAYPKGIPILRKEFIFDPYQVYEARAYGADFILLIVAMLDVDDLTAFQELARQLGMECLVEVHDEGEVVVALDIGASIIGINNRDLRTFTTDIETTERLAPSIPAGKTIVSESGINTRQHIERVRLAGAHAALIGEALVTSGDPGAKLRELA
jgi:indole-3-glycerol phosphate synthase